MTQIYSDEELLARLSKSMNDVKEGRTMSAETLRKKIRENSKKPVTV